MNIFLSSDLHLGHENLMHFLRADGTPLRVFDNASHMNEHIIQQHNSVVGPNDKWYCIGDIAMSKKFLPLLNRMNGEKVLIRGNHDTESAAKYLEYFKDVRGVHQFDGMILSHVPIHPESLGRWGANVHGHLHANVVTRPHVANIGQRVPDDRYINVSMEQLDNYTPISLEDVKKKIPYTEPRPRRI